jgi:hypothetical protein
MMIIKGRLRNVVLDEVGAMRRSDLDCSARRDIFIGINFGGVPSPRRKTNPVNVTCVMVASNMTGNTLRLCICTKDSSKMR